MPESSMPESPVPHHADLIPYAGRRRPRTIAVVNQKGGVGKTTTTINLGTALAAVERRVLIVDLDPQGNASTGLGIHPMARRVGTYDLLLGDATVDQTVLPTAVPGLSIIPSTMDLSGAEIELVPAAARDSRLREALAESERIDDYVLIDCPPSLGLLTLNALVAADAVLVPLQTEFLALEGLSHLLRTLERIRQRLNPALQIQGVVLTMVDRRNNLSNEVEMDVRRHLQDKVYHTVIPRNVRVSEAPSHGKPAIVYDLKAPGAQAYVRLAAEFLRREEGATPALPQPLTAAS